MKHPLFSAAAFCGLCLSAHAQVVINELLGNTQSTDTEFIELYNAGASPVDISNWVIEIVESDAGGSFGTVDRTATIPAATTLNAGGYYLLGGDDGNPGNTALTFVEVYTSVTPDQTFAANFIENSSYTAILKNDVGVLQYSAYLTDGGAGDGPNDGGVAITPDVSFGPDGNFIPAGYFLAPDGSTTVLPLEFSPVPAPSATPGAANPVAVPLTLTLAASSVSESAGFAATTATVSRVGTSGDLEVFISNDDETEALAPISVMILDGNTTSDPFDIDAVDDLYPDGTQVVTFEVSGAAAIGDSKTLDVTDDVTDAFSLVINEFHPVPDASTGDVNGDGVINNDDEFVEIVNTTGSQVDLTGFTIRDSGNLTHNFRPGTLLDPGCAVLVFSGQGALSLGTTAAFSNAEVQVASEGTTLRLTNSGDSVLLLNDLGEEVHGASYGDLTGTEANGSVALTIDKDGSSGFGRHGTIGGASGSFSPGTFLDGTTPFCTVTQSLTVVVTPGSFDDTAGLAAATAVVSLPSTLGFDLLVELATDDSTEAVPGSPSAAFIFAGDLDSSPIPLDAVDDMILDGNQTVTVSAIGSGYLNGTTTVTVTDDLGPPAFTNLVINELDADQDGDENGEFVELLNLTSNPESLAGLVLVFYNGNGNTSYEAYNLSGTIPANGYFVLGDASVPNVNLTPANFSETSSDLQNGADAVALYVGTADDFPNGTAVTATNLVDAVVYGTDDPEATGLTAVLGGPQANEGASQNATSVSRSGPDTYAMGVPSAGADNVFPSGDIRILSITPDFSGAGVVTMSIGNLTAGLTYSLDSTTDLTEAIPFAPVLSFDTTLFGGTEAPAGVFTFDFPDTTILSKDKNFYQVTGP